MNKNTTNSTISELFNLIDEPTFLELSNVMNLNKYVKNLTAYQFFQLVIIAQLNEVASLTRMSKQTKDKDEFQK